MYHETFDITLLKPSPTNPRQHFDPVKLAELASSLKEHGVLEPLIIRKFKGTRGSFEIVAGERRFRAATLAELKHVPVLERELTDEQVIEIQLIENIQRDDLTPLEQARGYRALIDSNPSKHTVASTAARVGMSEAWVWDRLKLNDLIPAAKALLEQDRISTGHAILVARQKPEQQKRIIDPFDGGLFEEDGGFQFDDEDADKLKGKKANDYDGLKPVSVRELEKWIADHIRFDITHAAKAVPLQFEAAAAQVEAAAAQPGRGKKVIAITFEDGFIAEEAKDPSERTYGRKSWRLADGTKKSQSVYRSGRRQLVDSPECEYSVLGLVAVGQEHYGETFPVCIARDKCLTHWGVEIKEREKNQKLRETGQGKKAAANEKRQESAYEKQQKAEQLQRARWEKLGPALRSAIATAIAAQKKVSPALLAAALKELGLPTVRADQLPAMLVKRALARISGNYPGFEKDVRVFASVLKVDVKAIEKRVLPDAEPKKAKTAA